MAVLKETLEELRMAIETEYMIKEQLREEEDKKDRFECKLWLTTDFAKALKHTNNTESMRKMYVKEQMLQQFIDKTGSLKNDLSYVQKYIDYLNKRVLSITYLGEETFDIDDEELILDGFREFCEEIQNGSAEKADDNK